MRFLFILILLLSVTPCWAGKKDRVVLDVRGDLHICNLFDQGGIYLDYKDVLEKEGLARLVPVQSPDRWDTEVSPVEEKINETDDEPLFVAEGDFFVPCMDFAQDRDCQTGARKRISRDQLSQRRSISYDSPHVTNQQARQNSTTKDLNRALKNEFMRRKLYAMKKELALGCSPVVCDLGFNTIFAWTGCLGPFGGGMALVKVMTGVRDLSRELLKAVGAIHDDEGTDPLTKYELKYAKRKRFLPDTLQETIENIFQMAYDTDKGRVEALDKLPKLLRLPIYSKEPNRSFINPIERLTKGFQTDEKEGFTEGMLKLLVGHYSRYQPEAGPNLSPKYIICLEGMQGIGKTHLVQNIAGEMELDFICISLSEGISAVFGDNKSPGTLVEALTKQKNARNLVIFFDEADGALNNPKEVEFWKKFFDPNSPGFYSRWANADIDLSHALFFIACNNPIKDPALQDRMWKFYLKAPTCKQKEEVLRESIVPNLGKSRDSTMAVHEKELGEDFVHSVATATDGQGFRPSQQMIQDKMNAIRLERLREEALIMPYYKGHRRNGFHLPESDNINS